jgi:hypothetical protein
MRRFFLLTTNRTFACFGVAGESVQIGFHEFELAEP